MDIHGHALRVRLRNGWHPATLRSFGDAALAGRASPAEAGEQAFEITAGSLCLDLANTVSARSLGQPCEHLHDFSDLVAWARQAAALSDEKAHVLRAEASRRPTAARHAFRRALGLREALYAVGSALAAGRPLPLVALELISDEVARAAGSSRVVAHHRGLVWDWTAGADPLESVTAEVARSALDLLTSDDLDRVRQCAGRDIWGCDWLFIDRSGRGSRQWCDKSTCANRAKARRHRQRIRERSST
jgi:predicted RNA-binding Zn ribbon-like protein